MLPRVYELVLDLGRKNGIGYVRRVHDHGGSAGPLRRLSVAGLNWFGRRAKGSSDRTVGVLAAGHLTNIEPLLEHVDGTTELVAHPGMGVEGYPHWRYQWDAETNALCDPALREKLAEANIELIAPSAV